MDCASPLKRRAIVVTVYLSVAIATASAADRDGFSTIFDGQSLDGWRIVPAEQKAAWSVQGGLLVGNSDGRGSDLIWKADDLGDFELKLAYRFRTPGNSGVHIRGQLGESESHRVKGYHADLGHVGIGPDVLGAWDFHGTPRGSLLVERGHRVVIDEWGEKHVTGIVGALTPEDLRKHGWNEVHVVARGYRLFFTINRRMASEVIDHEAPKRIERGVIGLQLHGGPPMTIEFRDIRLKR